jgi:hypothetical protein
VTVAGGKPARRRVLPCLPASDDPARVVVLSESASADELKGLSSRTIYPSLAAE